MYYNDTSPFNNPHTSLKSHKWDPETVMGLANRDVGDRITCIGWATSRNRRCQRGPARHKIASAVRILNRLACKNASKAAGSPELREAAELLLCWQHQHYIPDVLKQWRIELEDWDEDYEDDDSSFATFHKSDSRTSSTYDKSRVKEEPTEDLSAEELRRIMKQMQEDIARLNAKLRGESEKPKKRDEGAEKATPQRDSKQQEEEQQAREEERRRREKEQKRRQEEEDRRKEEERRREEEKKREEEAREKARREREFRERVRLAKEEREREARRKLEKEAAEWHAAWTRYSRGWDKLKNVSVANMPWPVKSGLQSDVNEANVRLFFAKAPPEELVKLGDKRWKFINAENLRWHTDKVMQRFGPDAVDGDAKNALSIIAKVMIALRQDAQKEKET
ncbi:hypothetical protein M434DRAFT_393464 [Hypoxylon sp. CO27-5]|nr:hypothetical protein M434DRAFT_393464 [Hypoxylon sp. CO27-5]